MAVNCIIRHVKRKQRLRQTFTLVTDQRSLAFMLDSRRCSKIKNEKIQQWWVELAAFSYVTKYRPGQQNTGPDALTRAHTSTMSTFDSLGLLHKELCYPGVTRLLHFVRAKNLPFSTTDVKAVVSICKTCAEVKPQFYRGGKAPLVKAMKPMERLSLDFKGPVLSRRGNAYLLILIEYSCFPFAFPCKDMTAPVDTIFTRAFYLVWYSVPPPRVTLVGLPPPKQSQATPNWDMKHYKLVDVCQFLECQDPAQMKSLPAETQSLPAKPQSPPVENFLATVLVVLQVLFIQKTDLPSHRLSFRDICFKVVSPTVSAASIIRLGQACSQKFW